MVSLRLVKSNVVTRDLGGLSGILEGGLAIWQQDKQDSIARAERNAQLEIKRLELEALVKAGELSDRQYQQQMALLNKQGQGGGGNTVLYIVGGIVLLGAIGTTIYFATRKK